MKKLLKYFLVVFVLAAAVGGAWYLSRNHSNPIVYKTPEESDQFVRFDMEIYDKILANFWKKGTDADLADLFRLSLMKAASTTDEVLPTRDRAGTAKMLGAAISKVSASAKKDLSFNMAVVVLYNLPPAGRSDIMSSVQEKQFRNNANNINPSVNLYSELGLADGASATAVEQAHTEKAAELQNATTTEAKNQLKELDHAYQVLNNQSTKNLYDQTKMEPTVYTEIIGAKTLYINMSKVSAATFGEFVQNLDSEIGKHQDLQNLIVDLRGNIGGSLDFAEYFLGLFIGPNQYAFDLYHQDNYEVQRTPAIARLDSLKKFKEIAFLTDNMTQSTAELTAAVFKRMNLAKIVGATTRGWGTVENTFPLDNTIDPNQKYSLLLVHSLTLRDDNQPIEGRGISPDVDIKDPNWKTKLSDYFHSADMIKAIEQKIASAPAKS